MFAHQVIEDMKNRIKNPKGNDEKYIESIKLMLPFLINSQKFYLGKVEQLPKIQIESMLPPLIDGFTVQNRPIILWYDTLNLKTPYDVCWIEVERYGTHTLDRDNNIVELKTVETVKQGILTIKDDDEDETHGLYCHFFSQNLQKTWQLQIYGCYVEIGKDFRNSGQQINLIDINCREIPDLVVTNSKGMIADLIHVLMNFMKLISCKNIHTEKIPPPLKLNKKRIKSGKHPIFEYHVLNLVLPSNKKRGYQEQHIPISHNRVHLCRGHFKRYTPEHPLFGKHTGLYWWEPSVRGQNRDGIIMKDYKAQI